MVRQRSENPARKGPGIREIPYPYLLCKRYTRKMTPRNGTKRVDNESTSIVAPVDGRIEQTTLVFVGRKRERISINAFLHLENQ
jgi:hypothetical protein